MIPVSDALLSMAVAEGGRRKLVGIDVMIDADFGEAGDVAVEMEADKGAHWVGGSEDRRFVVWLRPLGENDTMIVLTHGVKGTVYEVARADYKSIGNHSKDIIGFLEDTLNRLEKCNGRLSKS